MNEIKVNVYGDNNEIIKTCTAKTASIKFGTIRAIMRVLNVESINDTTELLKTVYGAWGQLVKLLNDCFPDMSEEDWDNVPLPEVYSAVLQILKSSFSTMTKITGNEKN